MGGGWIRQLFEGGGEGLGLGLGCSGGVGIKFRRGEPMGHNRHTLQSAECGGICTLLTVPKPQGEVVWSIGGGQS